MASLQETFAQRQNESANKINSLYDRQAQANQASLKADFDRNLSNKQAALGQISPQYQNQANSLAANYERQRRNANMSAMTHGLGSGTALQQQTSLNNKYLQNYGDLRTEEAQKVNEANQGIADLRTAYNNALVKAQTDADIKRDQALIEDYNKQQNWYDQQAANLANYGNFDAYKNLYGEAQANNMRNTWISKNPDVALRSGMISREDYKKLTGKDPQFQSIY